MDLIMKKSMDGGKTWSEAKVLADGLSSNSTYNNPVMIPEENSDTVHLVYCKSYSTAYYQRSEDNGETWSDPVEITSAFEECKDEYDWKVIATGPGHGIQLDNGRLLVPVWLALNTSHHPSVVSTIYSDDGGETWNIGELIPAEGYMPDPNETAAVQLSNGDVMLNMRNTAGTKKRALTVSKDGISGWSKPQMHPELDDPTCFGGMTRLTSTDEYYTNRILFVNSNNTASRNNITVKMSMDEWQTWTHTKTIETGNISYSDIAVSKDKEEIYVLYEVAGTKVMKLARFNLEWLTEGEQSLDPKFENPTKVINPTTNITLNEEWNTLDSSWSMNINEDITINNGKLLLSSNGTQKEIINRDVNITDNYTIEFKVKVNDFFQGPTGNNVTLGTKVHDGFYRLMLDLKEDGVYAMTTSGGWSKVADVNLDNHWHEYKAVVNKGVVTLYIDNIEYPSFNIQMKKDEDYIQHWVSGKSDDQVDIEQEYLKIYNNSESKELSVIESTNFKATATSEETSRENTGAKNVVDGNSMSFWHTNWDDKEYPHTLDIDFGGEFTLEKIGFLPRQDAGTNGMITEYELFTSIDGENFELANEGTWTYGNNGSNKSEKIVTIEKTLASHIKLVANSSLNQTGFASLSEVKFYRDSVEISEVPNISLSTTLGTAPLLPTEVETLLSNGDKVGLPVQWLPYDLNKVLEEGNFEIQGKVNNTETVVTANISVNHTALLPDTLNIFTEIGVAPSLPSEIELSYTDGSTQISNVTWKEFDSSNYSALCSFKVFGKASGLKITALVNVLDYEIFTDGDFNQDGKVDIGDLAIASKHQDKNSTDNKEEWSSIRSYDINSDEKIDEFEILSITNIIFKD